MNAIAVFGIVVGGASVLCYLLMTRVANIRRSLRSSGDVPGSMNYATGDGWSLLNRGGGHDYGATEGCGNTVDFGGGDSRGNCDAGGGSDGGGGGD